MKSVWLSALGVVLAGLAVMAAPRDSNMRTAPDARVDGGAPAAPVATAKLRDAGTAAKPLLTAERCAAVVEHLVTLAVDDEVANDAEVKALPETQRVAAVKMAHTEAMADAKVKALEAACLKLYDSAMADCMMAATSMSVADECGAAAK